MTGIARKDQDSAGGKQLNGGQSVMRVEGSLVVLLGDPVEPHGTGRHGSPVMAEGSSVMRINAIPVCRAGHKANCGHATTGSAIMRVAF